MTTPNRARLDLRRHSRTLILTERKLPSIEHLSTILEELPFLVNVPVDCLIFGVQAGALKVLLLKGKHTDRWSLPGGLIGRREQEEARERSPATVSWPHP